jgi:ribosome-associated protein
MIPDLYDELAITAMRSSGPGGQHVNKVSTKIELRFNVPESKILTDQQKLLLLDKLRNKLTDVGDLIVISQATRSQSSNKELALIKLYEIIAKALKPDRKRIQTKPTSLSKLKRLDEKKIVARKKENRKPPLNESNQK